MQELWNYGDMGGLQGGKSPVGYLGLGLQNDIASLGCF